MTIARSFNVVRSEPKAIEVGITIAADKPVREWVFPECHHTPKYVVFSSIDIVLHSF